ncbi:hypothetical protein [Streptomyces sp. enrichment culture]|uniref:hypothetical protein n=1 Tax=Streptomyces sp. enrichment culture TaxID=1795815 RepID=UPI003F549889
MRRLPLPSRTAAGIAALTVAALVPLCGVAQAAEPTPGGAPSATAPGQASSGTGQQGRPKKDQRLVKLGKNEGLFGLGILFL